MSHRILALVVALGLAACTHAADDATVPVADDQALTATRTFTFDDSWDGNLRDVTLHTGQTVRYRNIGRRSHLVTYAHSHFAETESAVLAPGQSIVITVRYGDHGWLTVHDGLRDGWDTRARFYGFAAYEHGVEDNCDDGTCPPGTE